jgi:hypothetical protein
MDQEDRRNNLVEAAHLYLEPELRVYGIRRVTQTKSGLRYVLHRATVSIALEEADYRIRVLFQRHGWFGLSCSLHTMLEDLRPIYSGTSFFQAYAASKVAPTVESIAQCVGNHADGLCKGRLTVYWRVLRNTHRRWRIEEQNRRDGPLRAKANHAWERKDYRNAYLHYRKLGRHRTAIEQRRLEYSREHQEK